MAKIDLAPILEAGNEWKAACECYDLAGNVEDDRIREVRFSVAEPRIELARQRVYQSCVALRQKALKVIASGGVNELTGCLAVHPIVDINNGGVPSLEFIGEKGYNFVVPFDGLVEIEITDNDQVA
ncbi:MAG: hypothetical protein WC873_02305 [Candidatus Gracilibacteria bacterium]